MILLLALFIIFPVHWFVYADRTPLWVFKLYTLLGYWLYLLLLLCAVGLLVAAGGA